VLGGGKRLRPVLVYLTGQAFGAPLLRLDAPAAALELIHAYSLIHDDLPGTTMICVAAALSAPRV
jgi:geranylgeranyl pyrophosphate synthase